VSPRFLVVLLLVVGAACAPSPTGTNQFPIIGSDPDRLVENMEWVTDAPTPMAPDSFEEPVVLETSTASAVQIAVKGGGCPPTAQVVVSGSPEAVEIIMNLGGAIQPEGVDCPEILTTHILGIHFRQAIDLKGLTVVVVRASGP
jgi:hypothetical protein